MAEVRRAAKGMNGKLHRFMEPIWGYVFISPWLLGLFVLTVGPMSQSFYLSLTQYNLLESPTWVGIENYHDIFMDDPNFWKSLQVTLTYVVMSVPLKLFFALLEILLKVKPT